VRSQRTIQYQSLLCIIQYIYFVPVSTVPQSLKKLTVINSDIDSFKWFNQLLANNSNVQLKSLHLERLRVLIRASTEYSDFAKALATNDSLTELQIMDTKMEYADLILESLEHNRSITKLIMTNCGMIMKCRGIASVLNKNSSLLHLEVSVNYSGLVEIAARLINNSCLRYLELDYHSCFYDALESLNELRSKLPHCIIEISESPYITPVFKYLEVYSDIHHQRTLDLAQQAMFKQASEPCKISESPYITPVFK
jgi:hypothetical protein